MRVHDHGTLSGYMSWYQQNKKCMTMDGIYHSSNQKTAYNEVTDVSLCGHLGCA